MQIHFLLEERLNGYVFNPDRPQGLTFLDTEANVEIGIRAGGEAQHHDYGHRNLELWAKVSRDVTDQQYSFVEALLNQRVVQPDQSPVLLPYSVGEREVVASDGRIAKGYSPTSNFLPEDLQSLCASTGRELQRHAVRFVQLLRWLEKASGPDRIFSQEEPRFRLYWKTTQELYHSVPWPKQGSLVLKIGGGLTWSTEDRQAFSQLWKNARLGEPLGHQLLREAKEIAQHSPRSALLICYSALEVALKQHIAKCAPDAGWLAMEVPTPPLSKILKNFLPKIHSEKEDFQSWDQANSVFKLIQKFGEDRNRLAHRGEESSASLDDYLRTTSDLLFAFDVLEGHAWAKAHVSCEFGKLLGWKTAGHGTVIVKLQQ
jgi:hypothetical protein